MARCAEGHENPLANWLCPECTPGATGEFPQGKLTPDDEGELRMAIMIDGDKVVLDFGKSVHWLAFDTFTAKALGHRLIRRAQIIEKRILDRERES